MKNIFKYLKVITIFIIAIVLSIAILGLKTERLPSGYKSTSYNYGKDKRFDVYIYQFKVGNYNEGPHPYKYGDKDGIALKLKYSGGTRNNSYKKIIELRRFGMLFYLLPYKNRLIFLIFALCIILCIPRNKFTKAFTYGGIYIHSIALILIGLVGLVIQPQGILNGVPDTSGSAAGIFLMPLALIMALFVGAIYILAIIAGASILMRKHWAIILAISIQSAFCLTLPFLLSLILKPSGKSIGWEISIVNPYFYIVLYLLTIIIAILFFNRAETKEYFLNNKKELVDNTK
ncbi:MAG: hypothetical protein GY853_10320 [PVC group bacterium]|nr:hypothetical protein [PVC group bacterium]